MWLKCENTDKCHAMVCHFEKKEPPRIAFSDLTERTKENIFMLPSNRRQAARRKLTKFMPAAHFENAMKRFV